MSIEREARSLHEDSTQLRINTAEAARHEHAHTPAWERDNREARDDRPRQALRVQIGWRAVVTLAAAIFIGMGLLGAIRYLLQPLAILILGVAFASALATPVAWLSRWLPRTAAILLVHMLVLLLIGGAIASTIPTLASEVQQLNDNLPATLDLVNAQLDQVGLENVRTLLERLLPEVVGAGTRLLTLPLAITDALFGAFAVFFFSLYGLMAAPQLQRFIISAAPETHRPTVYSILDDMVGAVGGYIRGVFFTAIFVGVMTYIGLRVIGVPYPLVLGVLAGLLEVIPVIGTTISVITITGVAWFSSLSLALVTLAFMMAVQLLEGNVLFPNIVGRQARISPLLSMFAFFAGVSVGGIIGGFIGVPVAAALRVLVMQVIAPAVRRWTGAEPEPQEAGEGAV